jgi:hypothetical protein
MEKVTAQLFYQAWLDTVTDRRDSLLTIWRKAREFTSCIKGSEDCVINEVAKRLSLLCYPYDYYSIDAILYKVEDLTPGIKPNTNWFRDIRVAFEHENNFRGGLFQEVSHLLITNCDLRVLVTYPNEDTEKELHYLHEIISGNRQSQEISEKENFLLIFGYETDFTWEGLVFKQDKWKLLTIDKETQ